MSRDLIFIAVVVVFGLFRLWWERRKDNRKTEAERYRLYRGHL